MYEIKYTNKMKRDVKRMQKRGKDINKLINVLDILVTGNELPEVFHDHKLTGNLSDFRECHIESDWLLVYQIRDDILTVIATETGTHADLFGL